MIPVAYRASALAGRRMVSSPAALTTVAVFYLMVTVVLSTLWWAAAQGRGGSIVGYSAVALVWYIATAEATVNALPFRLFEEIGSDITSGQVESELLRPTPVLLVRMASELGVVLPRLAVCAAVGTVFALIRVGSPPSLAAAALAIPSLVLAVVGNLAAHHLFAALAFWLRDTRSAWFIYQKLVFVLGGMLLPLEVLPRGLELTAKVLPFAAFAYAPGRLAAGHVEPWWLAVQAAWLVVLTVLAAAAFRAGEHRLTRVGA